MSNFLRDLFFTDFWLKLFSFALAVLCWFTVDLAVKNDVTPGAPLSLTPYRRTFPNLPVVVLSSAEDVRSARVNPKEVEVTVEGERRILEKLQSREIRVLIDLTGIEAAHDLRKRIEVSTPAGVTHVKVDPEEVQVSFPRS